MKTCSKFTKRSRFQMIIAGILTFLCSFGPLIYFTIVAYANSGTETIQKTTFTMTAIAAVILAIISSFRKLALRSPLYIFMIGIWFALDNLLPFITAISVCTLFDELVFSPWYNRARENYYTNIEMDKRNLGD